MQNKIIKRLYCLLEGHSYNEKWVFNDTEKYYERTCMKCGKYTFIDFNKRMRWKTIFERMYCLIKFHLLCSKEYQGKRYETSACEHCKIKCLIEGHTWECINWESSYYLDAPYEYRCKRCGKYKEEPSD